jgi:recombination associated protein RdgC
MWFRNLVVYRLPADWSFSAAALEEKLARRPLQPCSGYDLQTRGWVPPAGATGYGRYVRTVDGHHLLALGVHQKILPASVVNQMAKERAVELAAQQGHPVGRRQMRELKERVSDELRAKALTRRHEMRAWLDPARGRLIVDSASTTRAEELVETLRDTLGSPAVQPLHTAHSPAAAMGAWLLSGRAPGRFNIEQDLELQSKDDGKSVVKYVRHPLDGKDIHRHLSTGKRVVRLGLSWHARLALVLDAGLQIKRMQFLDMGSDQAESQHEADEQFDVDFALMTGEVGQILDELVTALGGTLGENPGENDSGSNSAEDRGQRGAQVQARVA